MLNMFNLRITFISDKNNNILCTYIYLLHMMS
jgi:hypothetical protein